MEKIISYYFEDLDRPIHKSDGGWHYWGKENINPSPEVFKNHKLISIKVYTEKVYPNKYPKESKKNPTRSRISVKYELRGVVNYLYKSPGHPPNFYMGHSAVYDKEEHIDDSDIIELLTNHPIEKIYVTTTLIYNK